MNDFREQTMLGQTGLVDLVSVYFRRSPFSFTYTRGFKKVDDFFSYLGGFIELMVAIAG